MRSFQVLALLGLAASAIAEQKIVKNTFGYTEIIDMNEVENEMKKLVVWNGEPWTQNYEEVADFITELTATLEDYEIGANNINYKCNDRIEKDPEDPGYFLPVFIEKMNKEG